MSRPKMTDRDKFASAVWKQGEPAREANRERLLANGVPVPTRITLALDYRGLYGPEVDEALGGEEPMVDEWEAGRLIPTPEQMRALAELTQYPLEFFYKPIEGDISAMWMCRRHCEYVPAKTPINAPVIL